MINFSFRVVWKRKIAVGKLVFLCYECS